MLVMRLARKTDYGLIFLFMKQDFNLVIFQGSKLTLISNCRLVVLVVS